MISHADHVVFCSNNEKSIKKTDRDLASCVVGLQTAQRHNSDNDSCHLGVHQIVLTEVTTSIGVESTGAALIVSFTTWHSEGPTHSAVVEGRFIPGWASRTQQTKC